MSDAPRCYTIGQVLALLQMKRPTFFAARKAGRLPFLEELRPRLSNRTVRYRAEPIDRYLKNEWTPDNRRHYFGKRSA